MPSHSKLKYLNPIKFYKKIIAILSHPRNNFIRNLKVTFNNIFFFTTKKKDNYFFAIYDLEFYPNTFNFLEFLILCNLESKKRSNKKFFVIFIPRKKNSLNNDIEYYKIIDDKSYQWRLYNLLYPLVNCSKLCIGFNHFHDRETGYAFIKDKELFPKYYNKFFQQPLDIGDIYLVYPTVLHGVETIDKGSKVDWNSIKGRWFMGFYSNASDENARRHTVYGVENMLSEGASSKLGG